MHALINSLSNRAAHAAFATTGWPCEMFVRQTQCETQFSSSIYHDELRQASTESGFQARAHLRFAGASILPRRCSRYRSNAIANQRFGHHPVSYRIGRCRLLAFGNDAWFTASLPSELKQVMHGSSA
eukprot:6206657-Pleurochrysis_carterae.AAC.3